jgi:predicted lipid-binding transport protein (Tim44 family)
LEDLILSAEEVAEKAHSTRCALDELAQRDPVFDPSSLEAFITATFLQVQQCWEKRDYGPVRDLLAPALLAELEDLVQALRLERVLNRIEGLSVRRLEFVHVFCPEKTDRHEVTALITFEARAYFVHEETGAYVRGSREVLPYQEFWVFRRRGDAWRLRTIDRDPLDHRGLRTGARA